MEPSPGDRFENIESATEFVVVGIVTSLTTRRRTVLYRIQDGEAIFKFDLALWDLAIRAGAIVPTQSAEGRATIEA